jgi:sugar transferase (PEP-CTERM/EpsH1 system associated)
MTQSSLFLCHRLPYPPNKGDKIRSYALLRHLARRGPVHLACFVYEPEDLQYLDKVRELAGGRCYFERLGAGAKAWRSLAGLAAGKPLTTACFGSARLQAWVDQTLRSQPIDDVVVFGSAMAPYLLKAPLPPERVLFDMVDIDSDKWRQYAARSQGGVKWLYGREAEKLQALECQAAEAFGHTLLVSDFEADAFRTIAPASAAKVSGLTNGVDLEQFSPGSFENPFGKDELPIVMTGRMDYRPNHEGALWFAREVFPQVLKFLPNAKVHFVGAGPPAALREAAGPGVVVTGSVPDVRPYIQFAQAIIAPLHIARGVQNKVLEAMAMAKPVVATHDATRSLAVQAGHHLWVENEPRRFANAVVEALKGPDREKLARNARNYVEVHHSWTRLMQDFERHLELLKRPGADLRASPAAARPVTQLEFSAPCKS